MNSRPTHSTDHERARKSCLITHRCASETLLVVIFRGTVIFGFEQANQYTILNEAGDTVALLAEDLGGFGKQIGRQLLRTRRPFTATVFSPDGALLYPPACTCLLAVISAACCWARDIASSGCNVWVQISRGAVAAVLTQQWLHCAVGVGKCSWQLCMLASAAEHCTCLKLPASQLHLCDEPSQQLNVYPTSCCFVACCCMLHYNKPQACLQNLPEAAPAAGMTA